MMLRLLSVSAACMHVVAAGKLEGVTGCTCPEACNADGTGGPVGSCSVPNAATCPLASCYGDWCTAPCVDSDRQAIVNQWRAYQNTAVSAKITEVPCKKKDEPLLSPCFGPEITALYAEAIKGGAYKDQPPLKLKIRANVIDRLAWTTTTTTAAWCKVGTPDKFDNCLCTKGLCLGSDCDKDKWWYPKTCSGCSCNEQKYAGPSYFSKELFEADIAAINKMSAFKFMTLEAASYRFNKVSTEDWDWIKDPKEGFDPGNLTKWAAKDAKWLFDFFSVPYGLQSGAEGPHNLDGYYDVFYLPNFKTGGQANTRGWVSFAGLHQPAVAYLNEESSMSTKRHTSTSLIAHEMGHSLGLEHTFIGMETDKYKAKSCDKCLATAQSDPALTGDFITDTPPVSSSGAPGAYVAPSVRNAETCENTYNHNPAFCSQIASGTGNERNFMSYNDNDCQNTFSAGQTARMRCYLDQDFSQKHLPDMAPGLVLLTAEYIEKSKTAVLSWLPPVSEYWCATVG